MAFLSTPSGWRATVIYALEDGYEVAFLSTPSGWRATVSAFGFYPVVEFLSTPSGWRATKSLE